MHMGKRFRNKRGFTLGWVTITLMSLMVLLIFCLTIAGGYASRDVRAHSRMQAEFTSKTVAQAIAGDMVQPITDGSIRGLLEAAVVESDSASLELEGLNSDMGQVSLDVVYEEYEKQLSVTVRTVLKKEETVVVLHLQQEEAEGEWRLLGYDNGMEAEVLR